MLARGTKTVGPDVLMVTAGLGTAPASTGQLHGQGVGAQLPPSSAGTCCVISGKPPPHLLGLRGLHVPARSPCLTLSCFLTPAEGRVPESLLLTWPCSSSLLPTLLGPP